VEYTEMMEVKKSVILRTIPLLITICLFSFPVQAQYGGGSGTAEDPYLIYTAEQMNEIGLNKGHWGKHFKLMADIDLSDFDGKHGRPVFNIIGSYSSLWTFSGVFDGNGKTISNFSYTSTGTDNIGLFGYIGGYWLIWGGKSEIKDLGLINPNVDAGTGSYVGSLVGCMEDGTITGCYVEGGSVSGYWRVGGLVGENYGSITTSYSTCAVTAGGSRVGGLVGCNYDDFEDCGRITTCYSTGTVSGNDDDVGGLVGENSGSITTSYSTGAVTADGSRVGGLVGSNKNEWCEGSGYIRTSYSSGVVSGNSYVGGLVGDNDWDSVITTSCNTGAVTGSGSFVGGLVGNNFGGITTSYSTSAVTGDRVVGGLVGWHEVMGFVNGCYSTGAVRGNREVGGLVGEKWGEVKSSFWDIETSGQTTSGGGTGKTTTEMQMEWTFTEAGWDFVGESVNGIEDIWSICEGTNYPRLAWQIPAGDFVCPDGITIEDFVFFIEHWGDDNCDPNNDYCQGTDLDFDGNQ
jgi:hypothetical protein